MSSVIELYARQQAKKAVEAERDKAAAALEAERNKAAAALEAERNKAAALEAERDKAESRMQGMIRRLFSTGQHTLEEIADLTGLSLDEVGSLCGSVQA